MKVLEVVVFGLLLLLVVVSAIVVATAVGNTIEEEEREWAQFRVDNKCHIIGGMTGGFLTPPKTGWLCDDGKTYWR